MDAIKLKDTFKTRIKPNHLIGIQELGTQEGFYTHYSIRLICLNSKTVINYINYNDYLSDLQLLDELLLIKIGGKNNGCK